MKVVGYMDATVTAVPSNQMVAIISQEWHHADWWPPTPFKQGLIPFPSEDIVGYISEIKIY